MTVDLKQHEVGIMAFGGLNEVGKNSYGVQYKDEIIILDAGVKFPDDNLLGVDYVIPDWSYILDNLDKVKGVFISHGHEDHIGGIPFLLKQAKLPIYANQLTLALLSNKLEEHGLLRDTELHEINEDSVIKFDNLSVSFYLTTHSIPDAYGIVVNTPEGNIVFTGDYKFDFTPVGKPADLHKMAKIGSEGVLALLGDSTNAEVDTFTDSEELVGESLRDIILGIDGRIIFASFASNISRLQQAVIVAVEAGRKIAVFGRSMENAFKNARALGYITAPDESFIEAKEINRYPADEVMIMCTGSQGEPMAALSRIANGTHRQITIQPGDSVIFSSSPIPGNTQSVNKLINRLLEAGANVIHNKMNTVHTSGHGGRREQELMISLMQPKYFVPVHGEYRMLRIQSETAQKIGVPKDNCFIMSNGDMIAITKDSARRAGSFPGNDIYVDGKGIGDIGNIVLHDRHKLSEDGLVIITVTIDEKRRQILAGPEIVSRGFIYMRESGDMINDLQEKITKDLRKMLNNDKSKLNIRKVQNTITNATEPFLYRETKRKPMILPFTFII